MIRRAMQSDRGTALVIGAGVSGLTTALSLRRRGFSVTVAAEKFAPDMLVLGGLVEMDEWDLDIGLANYGPVREMLRRCEEFLPILRKAEMDVFEPVRVGLRPFRKQNVRLEREPDSRIIHNYGHGGSGFTFSWGCAQEVVQIVEGMRARVAA